MNKRHKFKQTIMGMLGSAAFGVTNKIKDPLEGLNIEEEYIRIQNKESKFPAMIRQMIELRFIHQSKLEIDKQEESNKENNKNQ